MLHFLSKWIIKPLSAFTLCARQHYANVIAPSFSMHLFLYPPAILNAKTGHVPCPRPVQKHPAGPNKGSAGPEGTSPCPFCGLDLIRWTDEWLWTWGRTGCPSLSLLSAVLAIVLGEKKTLLRPNRFEHQRCA